MNNEPSADPKQYFRSIHRQFMAIGLAAVAILAIGSVYYHIAEHLSWVDSLYFCTITLTTIGYGDIVPHTDASKLFTVFYVFVGIGIMATFANLIIKNATARRHYRRSKRKSKIKL
jgi:voltage-gated potassium channel